MSPKDDEKTNINTSIKNSSLSRSHSKRSISKNEKIMGEVINDHKKAGKSKSIFDPVSGTTTEDEESSKPPKKLESLMKLPMVDTDQELLFSYVSSGQLIQAKAKLKSMEFHEFQAISSYYNFQGDTVLHSAVRRQDESMVDLLLTELLHLEEILYDCLLLAVKESNLEIAEKVLRAIRRHPVIGKTERGRLSSLPRWKLSEFEDYMTPIMLAAIVGNYDLIALFAHAGEKLRPKYLYEDPYKDTAEWKRAGMRRRGSAWTALDKRTWLQRHLLCCCYENESVQEDMKIGYQRLHEYQAMTSPEMLCFAANTKKSYDPMSRALSFIRQLRRVQKREVEFFEEYQKCIDKLNQYVIQIVSLCGSTKELEVLLSRQEGRKFQHDRYPRIVQAIEMELAEFISHPHVQRCLYLEWSGLHWNEWRYLSDFNKIAQFFLRLIFLPLFLFYVFAEQGDVNGQRLAAPINRCFFNWISQIVFIFLLVAEILLELSQPNERVPPNIYLEIIIMFFVLGQFRALLRQFCFAKRSFFYVAWNYYDFTTSIVFFCCFFCWGWIYSHKFYPQLENNNNMSRNSLRRYFFVPRQPLERQYWLYYDPLMVADVLLAIGTTLACGKLLKYAYLHPVIGPIQVALGKGIKSIANFILFFVIVFAAFGLAITVIYAPYRGMHNALDNEWQSSVFTSHMSTIIEMYWNLFGLASAQSAHLISMNVTDTNDPSRVENYEHYITAVTGKVLCSVYSFFGPTIVFSSMLVAYITNRFGDILEKNDMNWRFHRARIWVHYSRASVMPPPFNLVPTFWDFISFFRMIRQVRKSPHKYFFTCNCAICFHTDKKIGPNDKNLEEETYYNLIKVLVKRYFRSKKALEAKTTASSEDIATLNEEVEELRELVEQANETLQKLESQEKKTSSPKKGSTEFLHSHSLKRSSESRPITFQSESDLTSAQPSESEDEKRGGGGGMTVKSMTHFNPSTTPHRNSSPIKSQKNTDSTTPGKGENDKDTKVPSPTSISASSLSPEQRNELLLKRGRKDGIRPTPKESNEQDLKKTSTPPTTTITTLNQKRGSPIKIDVLHKFLPHSKDQDQKKKSSLEKGEKELFNKTATKIEGPVHSSKPILNNTDKTPPLPPLPSPSNHIQTKSPSTNNKSGRTSPVKKQSRKNT